MTHAQIGMDQEVNRKYLAEKPKPSNFKIKRFVEDVDPKTSTVRGDQGFAMRRTGQSKKE
jgi:hypothetical protein